MCIMCFHFSSSVKISSVLAVNNSSVCSESRRNTFCTDGSVSSERRTCGNVAVDVGLLSATVCSFIQCKFLAFSWQCVICFENTKAWIGLASKLVFEYTNCRAQQSSWHYSRGNTDSEEEMKHNLYCSIPFALVNLASISLYRRCKH
jgi:hypothetical protein